VLGLVFDRAGDKHGSYYYRKYAEYYAAKSRKTAAAVKA
jgi:hypothetical protein